MKEIRPTARTRSLPSRTRTRRRVVRTATIADAGSIARVQSAAWRAAYTGILSESTLAAMTPIRQTIHWLRELGKEDDPGTTLVIEDVLGRVVGFAGHRPVRGNRRRLGTLYVDPDRHGRGLGTVLLAAVIEAAELAGERSVDLGCLARNPYRRFYRRFGARTVGAKLVWLSRRPVTELTLRIPIDRDQDRDSSSNT